MAGFLECAEEMMEESPDMAVLEAKAKVRDQQVLAEKLDFSLCDSPNAFTDPVVANDPRVFQSMLKMEERQASVPNYFKILQDDINPSMRSSITLWMFEVCEEEGMEQPVFLRAVQYMDNFLAIQKINRTQFQLLGAVCILISSKIAGVTISTQRLSFYTANSCSPALLIEWEMMILGILKWDVYGLVSSDFVQHLLHRLPNHLWDNQVVMDRIKTLTAYCATDHNFGIHLPSILASASVAAALQPYIGQKEYEEVLHTLQYATNIDMDVLRSVIDQVRIKVQVTLEENCRAPGKSCPGLAPNSVNSSNCSESPMITSIVDKLEELSEAGTPTDVADIHF